MDTHKNISKPIIILALGLVALCLSFWTGSRYPDLNAKAVLGPETQLSSLGFHPLFEIHDDMPVWKKIVLDTINWADTNLKGMSFAFLLGSFFLSLFPLLKNIKIENGFLGSVFGLFMGAPLGVCVNCAVPIAKSIKDAGASLQTALAVLLSSPSLNVVVLSLMFSVFPYYVGALKIGLTLFFVLLVVPLSCRFLFREEALKEDHGALMQKLALPQISNYTETKQTWFAALKWSAVAYFKSLFFVLKTLLPFMVLAGFLGSALVVLFPWENVYEIAQNKSWFHMLGALLTLSALGTFLPSPMGFDVILSSVMLQGDIPVHYASVLLFTLGQFSIYAFVVIWRFVSLRLACFLFFMTVVLGLVMGLTTDVLERHMLKKVQVAIVQTEEVAPDVETFDLAHALSYAEIQKRFDIQPYHLQALPSDQITGNKDGLRVSSAAFLKGEQKNGGQVFTRIQGKDIGLEQTYSLTSVLAQSENLAMNTMSVATGDVHQDGWPDIVLINDATDHINLRLYANIGGQEFIEQHVALPRDLEHVILVALVDLDGDTWLDIVMATNAGKNYVLFNDRGAFKEENLQTLGEELSGMSLHMAFADFEKRGALDIFLGNWSAGPMFLNFSKSQNMILRATDKRQHYAKTVLPGVTGETSTSLIRDMNADGHLDIYVGNDSSMLRYSDKLLLGDGQGSFAFAPPELLAKFRGAASTMSIDAGDIDNDLAEEYYIGQIAYTMRDQSLNVVANKKLEHQKLCQFERRHGKDVRACQKEEAFRNAMIRASNFMTHACDALIDEWEKNTCFIHLFNHRTLCVPLAYRVDPDTMKRTADLDYNSDADYLKLCSNVTAAYQEKEKEESHDPSTSGLIHIDNNSVSNVLLSPEDLDIEKKYANHAKKMGVDYGGWTWNARFADLNNDRWQDLYVTNGFQASPNLDRVVFYKNMGGKKFIDATTVMGLNSYGYTADYSYFDFDNNGALDIVSVPTDDDVRFFRNTLQADDAQALQIELRDTTSKNTHGIGAQVIVSYDIEAAERESQMRYIKGSGGYKSFDQPFAHFGLGELKAIDTIKIIWSDGHESVLTGRFETGQRYRITR